MKVESALAAVSLLPVALATFEGQCADLSTSFTAADTEVLLSTYVSTGTNITFPESATTSCAKFIVALTDICRLRLNVTTSSTSSVIVEAFMPTDWATKGKRSLMTGNGGLGAVSFAYGDMVYANTLGFAAIGHDNGHAGDTGLPFLNNRQVVKDYVWRALYKAGRIGKKAIKRFYAEDIQKSYCAGCSTGGRQAAPAINFEKLTAADAYLYKLTGPPGAPTFLTRDQWVLVHQMVVDQCDWIDGVLDGVLEDPMKCQPRPEALVCGAGQTWESDQCLTPTQVVTVRKFYEPFYGNNSELIAPRWNPLTREFLGFADWTKAREWCRDRREGALQVPRQEQV
ncbi:hypothetical protein ABW20_dc0100764 [Dactylellina cionopaga]|nr:hypothetical protein ABW20_dc0100764 [Dactylellina cionopaga]